jgi:hypothetical protein
MTKIRCIRAFAVVLVLGVLVCAATVLPARADSFEFTITNAKFNGGGTLNGTFDVNRTAHTVTDVDLALVGGMKSFGDWSFTPCLGLGILNGFDLCFDSTETMDGLKLIFPDPFAAGASGNLGKGSEIIIPVLHLLGAGDLNSGKYSIAALPSPSGMPEPSSALLLTVALTGMLGTLRRKRQA